MTQPYIKNCQKCENDFRTSDYKAKFHKGCTPKKSKPAKRIRTAEYMGIKGFIYFRDNHRCQMCEKDLSNDDHHKHCHHIDHNPNNNSTKNLITLCNGCHSKAHQQDLVFKVNKIEIKKAGFSGGIGATGENQFRGL